MPSFRRVIWYLVLQGNIHGTDSIIWLFSWDLFIMFGYHKAIISIVLWPTKSFAEELLENRTGWSGIKWYLIICLHVVYVNSIHSMFQIVGVKFRSLLPRSAVSPLSFWGDRLLWANWSKVGLSDQLWPFYFAAFSVDHEIDGNVFEPIRIEYITAHRLSTVKICLDWFFDCY